VHAQVVEGQHLVSARVYDRTGDGSGIARIIIITEVTTATATIVTSTSTTATTSTGRDG
jgi:hypothetical protein